MKKAIILLSIFSIAFFACKNPLKPSSEAEPSNFNAADSIPRAMAFDMINHYLDSVVDHSLDAIIKQTSLFNSDLYEIFKIKHITKIKVLAAAYLDTDANVARRNTVTELIQLKQGYHSTYYYYDIKSLEATTKTPGGDRLCPPPPGCSPNIEN